MTAAREPIDWSQLWNPGPRREFSAEELARAGGDPPSRTLVVMVALTVLLIAESLLLRAPSALTAVLTGLVVGHLLAARYLLFRLWFEPGGCLLSRLSWRYSAVVVLIALGLRWRIDDPVLGVWAIASTACLGAATATGMWFVAVYRAEQIAGRLREMAERERVFEMARQLATAQIQPHFLFNSLAALQHWVQLKDDRAAPLLDALCAYLRTTLPMFERGRLPLADEAESARQYLEVMRLRLGERLRYRLDIDPAAAAVAVPPGLLLTLVENAVEHGVQTSLAGAEVVLTLRRRGERVVVEVADSGPGLSGVPAEGVGLGNTRRRLAQAFGALASLQLLPGEGGLGCIARIEFPFPNATTPEPTT
jgi:signal transduction histidine kinase